MSQHDDEKSKARFEVIRTGRSPGIGDDAYYGYIENLHERVLDNLARFGGAGLLTLTVTIRPFRE